MLAMPLNLHVFKLSLSLLTHFNGTHTKYAGNEEAIHESSQSMVNVISPYYSLIWAVC